MVKEKKGNKKLSMAVLTKEIKEHERENIISLKEELTAAELSYETDLNTIPVVNVKVDELIGVIMPPWGDFWDNDKINLNTPVILGREKGVIAGPYQYFQAKEDGISEIQAVYIDSLRYKILSAENLKRQFKDEEICWGFAYSLYSLIKDLQDCVSYRRFCVNFERYFREDSIRAGVREYILLLNGKMED